MGLSQRDIGATQDNGDGTSTATLTANGDTAKGYEPIWYDSVKLTLGAAGNVTIPFDGIYHPETLQTLTGTNGISGFYDLSASTLTVDNPVNVDKAGTYTVTYTATIVGGISGQSVTTSSQQTVTVAPPLPNQAPITYSVVDDTTGNTLLPPTFFALGTIGESLATPEHQSQLQALEQSYQSGSYANTILEKVVNQSLPAPQDGSGYDLTFHLADKIGQEQWLGPFTTVFQTVHYSGAGGKTPADEVQSFPFSATIDETKDLFTGQVISTFSDWSAPQTSQPVVPPLLAGYQAQPASIPATLYSHDTSDASFTVTYTPLPASLTFLYQNGSQLLAQQKLVGVTDAAYDNTLAYNQEITALAKQGFSVIQTPPQRGSFAAGDQTAVIELRATKTQLIVSNQPTNVGTQQKKENTAGTTKLAVAQPANQKLSLESLPPLSVSKKFPVQALKVSAPKTLLGAVKQTALAKLKKVSKSKAAKKKARHKTKKAKIATKKKQKAKKSKVTKKKKHQTKKRVKKSTKKKKHSQRKTVFGLVAGFVALGSAVD